MTTIFQLRCGAERFFVCRADDLTPGEVVGEMAAETWSAAREAFVGTISRRQEAAAARRSHVAPAFRSRAERRAGLQGGSR